MNSNLTQSSGTAGLPHSAGPLLTLCTAAVVELVSRSVFKIPNPPAFLLLTVVFSAFNGGLRSGLTSTAIAWLYFTYSFSIPGHPFNYTQENLLRVIVWGVTTPLMALMVGHLKSRLEAADRAALRESENKYRSLVENIEEKHFIYSHDVNGIFTYLSPSVTKMLGYSQEDFLTHYTRYLTDNPNNREVVQYTELSIRGVKQPPYELEIYHKNGSVRWLEVNETPLFDGYGKVIAVQGIAQDITERKKLEGELLKTQKLESLGILAGGIAHDFNNFLTAILGNIDLALMQLKPGDALFERLLEAEKASLRARDLTQQLLTFSKGGMPVKKLSSIAGIIRDAAGFALRGSNVICEYLLHDDPGAVEIDEGQITQAINNLVINAVHSMPDGGVIKISAENILVETKNGLPLKNGEHVKITIRDSGTGIPKEHLPKIFDPYFTTKQKGSGLGLAVTFSIIKNHDGYITVESEPGHGTSFYIYLPSSHKQAAKESASNEQPFTGKGKILLMDDEQVIRDVAGAMLKKIGYEVVFARNGEEAIEIYEKMKETGVGFDIVIMDLTVKGGMGGKEAIRSLLEIDPEVKAIVSSGYSNDPVMSDYRKYGFKSVVMKPYKLKDLSETVHKIINNLS